MNIKLFYLNKDTGFISHLSKSINIKTYKAGAPVSLMLN